MAFVAEQVTAVWPPSGIAVACLLLFGRQAWPGVLIGAFLANITANEPAITASGISIGNTLEAIVAVSLLNTVDFRRTLDRLRDVLLFILIGSALATTVAATIGVASLCIGGVQPWERYGQIWVVYWLGDAMGVLVVAPLLLTVSRPALELLRSRKLEAAGVVGSLIVLATTVFTNRVTERSAYGHLEYVVFPVVIWAALRFGIFATAFVSALASIIAIGGTINGYGPFAVFSANDSLILLQLFMAAVTVTGLLLAAAISERKSAHAILEAITEGISDAVFLKDREGRYITINSPGARAIGTTVDQVIGRKDTEIFPGAGEALRKLDEQIMASQKVETAEETVYVGGEKQIYLSTKSPYFDHSGNVAGIIGVSKDITERKKADQKLHKSEERYRSLVGATSQVVWATNAAGVVVEDLPTWRAFTGQTAEQMLGRGWLEAIHPDDRQRVIEGWAISLAKGASHEDEFRLRMANGEYRNVLARGLPVCEADGSVREWIGTLNDITEARRAEAALKEADRRKDEFLAMLSHELRNPLTPIRTALHILKSSAPGTKTFNELLTIMTRQADHLIRLVDELLDASRIARGKIQLQKETVRLSSVVRHAIEEIEPLVAESGHQLLVAGNDGGLWLNCDATRLAQVISNLLNNAVKYSAPGTTIQLFVEQTGGNAVIHVRDQGIGIDERHLPHIFDLFYQSDQTLQRSQGGLGIGLTIVRDIIQLHGGRVVARSEGTGKGSEFIITLPRVEAPRDATEHGMDDATAHQASPGKDSHR